MVKRSGQCLCGDVTFEVTGEPVIVGHCHCRDCQKITGSGHSTFAFFPHDCVSVAGDCQSFAAEAESGGTMTRLFCPRCGSRLFARSTNARGLFGILLGAFDDPDALAPSVSLFTSRRRAWDPPAPGTRVFDRGLRD